MAKTIRLKCDVGDVSCSSMFDELTNEMPVLVCSDDASVDVGFFKNGRISEDVGEFKRAELYLKESSDADVNYFIKTASEINADLTIADWAAGKKHLSFSLDSVDTNISKGKKWLAVVLYYGDYGKSTYLAGNVFFVPSGTENEDVTEPEIANLKNEILSLSSSVSEKASEVASAAQGVNEKVLDAESYKNYAAQAAADSLKYRNEAEGFANSAAAADSSALQSANNAMFSSQSADAHAESAAESEKNALISLQSCEDIETNLEKLAEDVQSAKTEIENKLNEASSLAIEAGNSASIAADKATIAENASVAAEKAKADTGNLKSDVEASVSEFNSTVNAKVQEVESAAQSGITAVNSAKTAAVGEISGIKSEVEAAGVNAVSEVNAAKTNAVGDVNTAKTGALGEINTAKTDAVGDIAGIKGEVETAGWDAATEIAAALANAKSKIDTWSDQTERFAQNEEDISALAIDKANRGYLQFNKAKLTTATNNATTLPLTLCATVECDDWSGLKNISGAWNGGREFTFLNSLRVQYAPERFCGFNFGIGSQTGNAWTELLLLLGDNDAGGTYASNTAAYNIPDSKKITICASISEIENFAVKFYVGGALLKTTANKPSTLASNEIGGASIIATGNFGYATTVPQNKVSNVKVSRLKIFNCVLPATKADDVNGIGYTVEDYHNGVDEPPAMQDASATYRALLSLQDYTITNGSTQQVFDVSGNANDATVVLSDGGSLKGSNDISVGRLIDFIKGQSA